MASHERNQSAEHLLPPGQSSDSSTLDETHKQLYLHHESVVTALAGKDHEFSTASERATASHAAAEKAATTLSQIRATETKLSAELEQLQSKKLRRRLFPHRTAEQLTKLRGTLAAVSDDSVSAKTAAADARRRANEDASVRDALRADAEQLRASESARRAILESLFGGPHVGSEHENLVESQRDRLAAVTTRAKDSLSANEQALALLRAAREDLKKSRRHLWDAQVTNTVDIFNGGGFGFVAGLSTQYRFRSAADFAREAGEKIKLAVEINRKLPIAKLVKMHNTVFLGLADIFLDGIVTDLIVRVAVEKAVKSVDSVSESVKESIKLQKHLVEQLQGSVRGFSQELERTSDELVQIRAGLLQSAIQ